MAGELTVVFQKPNGEEEHKVFTTRPLGIDFAQKMPLVVRSVRGEASDIGVKTGWMITAVGDTVLDGMGYVDAYLHFKQASSHLRQGFILRDCPVFAAFEDTLNPVDPGEVPKYLKRFGYSAISHSAWESGGKQPQLWMGVIAGHEEKSTPYRHTWYALHSGLASAGKPPYKWRVERRLAHLRACLHDPVRRELGRAYNQHFKNARFAKRNGPPGTTRRLQAWLSTLAKVINGGKASPNLVAATLCFLEAPDLEEATWVASLPVSPRWFSQDHRGSTPELESEHVREVPLRVAFNRSTADRQAGAQPAQEFNDDESTDDSGATKCGVTENGDDRCGHPDVAGAGESLEAPVKHIMSL